MRRIGETPRPMILQAIFFYLFAGVCIASAIMVIVARNPVHSVLFLILAFVNAAGLFMLNSEWLPEVGLSNVRFRAGSHNSLEIEQPEGRTDKRGLVATSDRAIQPGLQRTMAARMKATTIEVGSSHVAMLAKPGETAKLILDATK